MLIRFSVENFMSYRDTQVFSMVAGRHTRHSDHFVELGGRRILKGSFFFGANAAGKSNLFEAMRFAKQVVARGLKRNAMSNRHFRIEKAYAERPGVFQFDIYANGHFYSYGFAISYLRASVEEEWLYLCDAGEAMIFERSNENGRTRVETNFSFSDPMQEQNFRVFSENVSDDKLLLSEISERKLAGHEDFSAYADVSAWFRRLQLISPNSSYYDKLRMLTDDTVGYGLERLLREFDTGIEGISLEKERAEDVLSFLSEEFKKDILEDLEQQFNEQSARNGDKLQKVNISISGRFFTFQKVDNQIFGSQLEMNHGNEDDLFELADESDGTQRLFDLIPVYRTGRTPCVIFVDELDRSFHTKLVTRFIQRFYEQTSGVESQLIATVHDSNVMDLDLLRQDEIWFVERQTDHSSQIYSLNKFKARFDKKVAKDYLLGRYGAIPCFSQSEQEDSEDV